ncbi:MAG: hypothetical protein KC643_15785 [Nitrospira sp.]|nr:hypothetical protein [Nitrospira sp.]
MALGVSPAYVCKLVRKGVIVLEDGLIDLSAARQAIESHSHGAYRKRRKVMSPEAPGMVPPDRPISNTSTQEPPDEDANHFSRPSALGDILRDLTAGKKQIKDISHVDVRVVLDLLRAQREMQDLEENAGRLLDCTKAREKFFQLADEAKGGVLNIANRVSGVLAANLRQLLLGRLDAAGGQVLEESLSSQAWESLVHAVIDKEAKEVLRALSDAPDILRQS